MAAKFEIKACWQYAWIADNEVPCLCSTISTQYPDYWTQGESVEELEEMLVSLYGDIIQFDDIQPAVPERTGLIAQAGNLTNGNELIILYN